MHTAGVPAEARLASTWSESTLPLARRVDPNATSSLTFRSSSERALVKNSSSLGLAPGQPPSMKATPR